MSEPMADAKAIFLAALECDGAEALARFLNETCGEDASLRQRVEELLLANRDAGDFLGGIEKPECTLDAPITETPGTMIGPYKLLQQIGEGGMGTVYMAEQTHPIQRKVALKLIKPGMDSKQIIARFEAERQALAMMDHVNIARVFDGGTIPLQISDCRLQIGKADGEERSSNLKSEIENLQSPGRPYFVMELVHGVPITKYCDDNHLTPRERLELFVPVCQAIQHAHQKGIIHRDIKPSNVMVTLYDGKPVPKVIDFGVAKATEQKLTERTLFTQFGTMVGTLEYMSPEQAEMSALGVDTRSDIYSLGVLLYELLTGSTPLTHKRMKEAAYAEILRMIKEVEPPKPSTRLSETRNAERGTRNDMTGPRSEFRAPRWYELDWIVMKCLEKDRNRRYETANSLSADVQRYLGDEPVLACPPSATYRLRKFARRNRAALLTIAAVVVALVAGTLISTWQAIRATDAEGLALEHFQAEKQARNEADANLQQAREAGEEFFTRVSESRLLDEPGLQPLRKELLEAAAAYYERLATRAGDDPRALTDLALSQLRLAQIYQHTGFGDRHIAALEEGIKRAEKLIAAHPDAEDDHLRLAGFWHGGRHVGGDRQAPTNNDLSLRVYQNAAALWEQLCQRYPKVIGFQNDLSKLYDSQACTHEVLGHLGEAVRMEKRVCEIRERIVHSHPGLYEHVAELGHAYVHLARLLETTDPQAAEDLYRRGLNLQKDAPDVATYQEFLANQQSVFGVFLARRDRTEEAIAAYRQALAIYQKLLARFPHVTNYQEALNAWQGELSNLQRPTSKMASSCLERGQFLYQNTIGKPQEAEAAFREAKALYEKLVEEYPADHGYRIAWSNSHTLLAFVLMDTQRWEEAEKALRRALAIRQELLDLAPADSGLRIMVVHSHLHLGALLAEAECQSRFGQRRPPSRILLAAKLGEVRRFQEAEQEFRQCVDRCEKHLVEFPDNPAFQKELAVSRYFLGLVLAARGRAAESATAYRQSAAGYTILLQQTPGAAGDWFLLAAAYGQLGEKEQARPWYDRAVEWLEKNKSRDTVLHRLHAECAELLGLPAPPKGNDLPSKDKMGLEPK